MRIALLLRQEAMRFHSMFCNSNGCLTGELQRRRWLLPTLLTLIALSGCQSIKNPVEEISADVPEAVEAASRSGVALKSVAPDATSENLLDRFCAGDLGVFNLSEAQNRRLFSVCNAWYPGSDLPEITTSGLAALGGACQRIIDGTSKDREFFLEAFGLKDFATAAPILCHLATLDRDDDNILDYRISKLGKFAENDWDVDNDGVSNVRDTLPLSSVSPQAVSCGTPLPEHLKFACAEEYGGEDGAACGLLHSLYENYNIVTINRDAKLTQALVEDNLQTVHDAVHLVMREGLQNHPGAIDSECTGVWPMQMVAFEECPLMRSKPWDDDDSSCELDAYSATEASAQAHNGAFTIYPFGSELPPIFRLGTYVHEFGHLWHFAYDVRGPEDARVLQQDNLWLIPGFRQELSRWGWELPPHEDDQLTALRNRYRSVMSTDDELLDHDEGAVRYRQETLQYLQNVVKYHGLLTSPYAQKYKLFSMYSVTSPWEWHADVFTAYLFRRLEDQLMKPEVTKNLIAPEFASWFRTRAMDGYRNQFYHPSLQNDLYHHFRDEVLPVNEAAADELVCRYLIFDDTINDDLNTASSLPYLIGANPIRKTPPYVSQCMQKYWKGFCEPYVDEKLLSQVSEDCDWD